MKNKNMEKVFPLMITAGLFNKGYKGPASKIETEPIPPRPVLNLISKRKLKKMKGKKARKNRGQRRKK